jgi:uncharacterized damage-inducible protein DinB
MGDEMAYGIDHLRMLFGYDRWANGKLFDAATRLTAEQLEAPGGASFDSVRGNLAHMLNAHVVWYRRLTGAEIEAPDMSTMDRVRAGLEASYAGWSAYLDDATPDELERILAYRDSEGVARDRPIWLLLAHLINHGTFHRGETGMMLASLGAAPGDLDIVYFYDDWMASHGTR